MGEPTIVLAHNPDTFPRLPHVNGITFAAHTHGGQVRFPFMGAPIVPSRYRQRYVAGHVEEGAEQMFVTSGIGTSLLPLRVPRPSRSRGDHPLVQRPSYQPRPETSI